jgi:DNA-binding protein YbaB
MLQDLVAAAVNAALAAAQRMVQEELQRVAGQATLNLRIPPG